MGHSHVRNTYMQPSCRTFYPGSRRTVGGVNFRYRPLGEVLHPILLRNLHHLSTAHLTTTNTISITKTLLSLESLSRQSDICYLNSVMTHLFQFKRYSCYRNRKLFTIIKCRLSFVIETEKAIVGLPLHLWICIT